MKKSTISTILTVLLIGAGALVLKLPFGDWQSANAIQSIEASPSSSPSPAPMPAPVPSTVAAVVPESTTTTSTLPDLSGVDWIGLARLTYGKCGEWHDLAIQVGWPEEEWSFLSQVIYRESRCQVDSWNGADAGLTQINKVHKKWLSEMGWSHPDDMFDPEKNLTFALRLWESSGWKPWRFSGPVPD